MNTGLGAGAVVPCGVRLRESEHRGELRRAARTRLPVEMLHAMFDERTVKLKILIGTARYIKFITLFGDSSLSAAARAGAAHMPHTHTRRPGTLTFRFV